MDATLGILQRFVPGGRDGWDLALDTMGDDADAFLGSLHAARRGDGRACTRCSAATSPTRASRPSQPSSESLGLLTATIDDEIESVFVDLPDDNDDVAPIRGRGEEVRERLRLLTQFGGTGQVIRHHGDFHLGQTLLGRRRLGAPRLRRRARAVAARAAPQAQPAARRRRDAALLLVRRLGGAAAPRRRAAARAGRRVRAPSSSRATATAIDPSLVPSGAALDKLLAVFELEKAVYELRYELNHRPDWVRIPVAGLVRMLDEEVPA